MVNARGRADDRSTDATNAATHSAFVSESSAVPEVILGEHEVPGVYPNPAGPGGAHVLFRLTQPSAFEVGIYDVGGRLVRRLGSGSAAIGVQAVVWDGRNGSGASVPGGIHLVRFAAGADVRVTKRFVFVR